MTQPILNPAQFPSLLLPAEQKFRDCLARGEPCVINGGELPVVPIFCGEDANFVRSEVIRFFVFGGDANFPIKGNIVSLRGAWIGDIPLNLDGMRTSRMLKFWRCHFSAQVSMINGKCWALCLNESRFAGGLRGDGIEIRKDLSLCGVVSDMSVSVMGGRIGGSLNCMGGQFTGMNLGAALMLADARIGGHLNCMCACISGKPERASLMAERVTVGGNVDLRGIRVLSGSTMLSAAKIGGDLNCSNGVFSCPDDFAFVAANATVNNSVQFRDGFTACGGVSIVGAKINRNLECGGGKFIAHNEKKPALHAENITVNNAMIWYKVGGNGAVNFASARIGALADDEGSWKPFQATLDGFVYDKFIDSPTDAKFRKAWLSSRPKGTTFSPQPYEQAAKVLFGMGCDNSAREILLEKERESSKQLKWWNKIFRWLWDKLAGYGYEPMRTFIIGLVFIAIGYGVFWCADESGRMVPHQPIMLMNPDYMTEMGRATGDKQCEDGPKPTEVVARLFPDYPEFNALVYSLDVFIPFFALHQEPYWYPKPREMDKGIFPYILPLWYWLEIGAGWILTSLFLLSITGILRPRQASGKQD